MDDIVIDWQWVRDSVLRNEKLSSVKESAKKESIVRSMDECLAEASEKASPKTHIVNKAVLGADERSILIEGGITFSSKDVSKYLTGAGRICLFAVTIGDAIEKSATSRMNIGDSLSGYLLDRIGSYACESLAGAVENKLRADYEQKGLSITMRLSPGYCDWPVEEQIKVDKAIGLGVIGITLNNNCMMSPKKSITAIVGIGPAGFFKNGVSQCDLCGKKDCYLRRVC